MLLEPLYAENIIVAIIYNNEFKWYVTDKELWFLDYNKLDNAYKSLGIKIQDNNEPEERRKIKVLDNENVDIFLQRINKYIATKDELNYLLLESIKSKSEEEDLLDFSPVLLINFDNKTLYSMFPEPASYEEYIPKGWVGKYVDFTELIPKSEKYWIDKFDNNLFLLKNYKKDDKVMSNENVLTILNEEFENDKTGEKVQGLTIIIDGKLKQVMDIIIEKDSNFNNYSEIIKDALFDGINNIINKIR